MAERQEIPDRPPLILGHPDREEVSRRIASIALKGRMPRFFWLAFAAAFGLVILGFAAVARMLTAGVAAYALILYSVMIDYPLNVGGRGLNAWPAYLVLAFEGGILGAAVAGVAGFLWVNALPTYHHPVFDTPGFTFAGGGGFWLMVGVDETDAGPMHDRLHRLGARQVEVLE